MKFLHQVTFICVCGNKISGSVFASIPFELTCEECHTSYYELFPDRDVYSIKDQIISKFITPIKRQVIL